METSKPVLVSSSLVTLVLLSDHSVSGSPSSLTIVIKLGTSSIIDAQTHMPLLSLLSTIAETVCKLKAMGHRVVIVSSGAIGVGMKRMGIRERGKGLQAKQVSNCCDGTF